MYASLREPATASPEFSSVRRLLFFLPLFFSALLLTSLATPASALGVGNAMSGRVLAERCAACHGWEGRSTSDDFPHLAGQHEQYLLKQLHNYRDGIRQDPIMNAVQLEGISDQELADLAAWYAAQTPVEGVARSSDEQIDLGERIYYGGIKSIGVAACIACHGPTGQGNPLANFPVIAGQHARYLAKTLKQFRARQRNNDPQEAMRHLMRRITDEEIDAVSHYLEGLH